MALLETATTERTVDDLAARIRSQADYISTMCAAVLGIDRPTTTTPPTTATSPGMGIMSVLREAEVDLAEAAVMIDRIRGVLGNSI